MTGTNQQRQQRIPLHQLLLGIAGLALLLWLAISDANTQAQQALSQPPPTPRLVLSQRLGDDGLQAGLAITSASSDQLWVAGGSGGHYDRQGARRHYADILLARIGADGGLQQHTILGGSGEEHAVALSAVQAGYLWLCGETRSDDFPVTAGAWQSTAGGRQHTGYVARYRLSDEAATLAWASYVGGNGQSRCQALHINPDGSGYIGGHTTARDLPAALNSNPRGSSAYILAFDKQGDIMWSRYLSGNQDETVTAITLIGEQLWIGGWSDSNNLAVSADAWQSTAGGGRDNFLARLSLTGELYYLSYLGGSGKEDALRLSTDGQRLWLAAATDSSDYPGLPASDNNLGGKDIYLTHWGTTQPIWQRRYGGSRNERLYALTVGQQDEIWLAGVTLSTDVAVSDDAAQTSKGKRGDGILLRVSASTGDSQYISYLGGNDRDELHSIHSIDNQIWAAGLSFSSDLAGEQTGSHLLITHHDQSNRAPIIDSLAITQALVTVAYRYQVLASDPDNDPLSYSLITAPEGMLVDEQGLMTWARPELGDHDITINVSDNRDAHTQQSYSLSVVVANQPPVITSSAVTDVYVNRGYRYEVLANDPDDALSYRLQVSPVGMVIDSSTGLISWTPNSAGDFNVIVIVDDNNGGTDRQSFVITVNDPDIIAPAISVTNPLNGRSTNQARQTIRGSVSEAATLTINGQLVMVDPDLTFTSAITLVEGANTITFTATDAASNVSKQTVTTTLDITAPMVTVATPADNTQTKQSDVLFSGNISEASSLTINGVAVIVEPDNSYSQTITISDGNNAVPVVATDSAGNITTIIININVDTTPAVLNIGRVNRGNPQNEIVMVAGLPGTTEAGALVHVINTVSGFEALVLAQSDGSFSTDVAGFANDSFTIFVEDAAGNQSVTETLAPDVPLTLTLDPIGNKIAPLGQTTRFTVTANDTNGEVITLGLTPLPLPAGMEYNITTGEVTFRPTADQVGMFDLTFSAESEDERVNDTISVTVPAIDPAAPTGFTGRVLDANSFTQGDLIPIVGATITFLGSGVSTTTDVEGYFTLSGLPNDAALFDIDASTASPAPGDAAYASFREGLTLVQNVVNQEERPFFLPRIDADSVTQVNPTETTVVNNPNLGITLTVVPNTAMNADGTPFVGELSVSEVPLALAPVALPDTFQPSLLITVQPVGVTFTSPVPITYPNVDNLPPNTEVDLYQVDRDLGEFVVIGTGLVSANGQSITTISGGITASTWGAPSPAQPENPVNPTPNNQDNECDCPKVPGKSQITLNDGRLTERMSLPAYRSLETSRMVTLTYESKRAYPLPVVPFNAGLRNGRTAIPRTVSYELSVSGLQQGREVFVSGSGMSAGIITRSGIAFSGEDFDAGLYAYELTIKNNFSRTSIGSVVTGDVLIMNEEDSPFGAGWMIAGLHRLAFNQDGSVLLVSSEGRPVNYRPGGTADVFNAPDNDFATFVRNPDGSYTHTEKDGVKMYFNIEGQITEHEDRNNNITAYSYDTDGKLIIITDPVGLETILTYDNNHLLETITDPANRATTFEHDVAGNLLKITYPDNTFDTFEYDGRHLMTVHEDERGNRSSARYDNFGRIIDATLPDGTIRAATSQSSEGLIDVASGEGTVDNPASFVLATDADGNYVDGRGNTSSQRLDPQGRALVTVDEIGRVTDHVRDADSNPTQTTRPIGSVVTRTFDDLGNILTQREEFNTATTSYSYDQFSLVTSVTNPRNNTTTITRDPEDGNPLIIVNELGHTTGMVYDSRGLVTSMTSPNQLVTTYTYNTQGLMDAKTETPPVGSPGNVRVWTYSYFPTGLLQTVNTPDGITLNYTYDDRSFLTSVTDNLNQSIIYSYDDHKNVTRTETRSSNGSLALLVDSIYDNRNRLIETRAPHVGVEESITQRILDENSNLIGLIDPNGNPSSNTYDPFNRLDINTHREGGVTDYSYDDQDRIIEVIAPNGVITNYEYDIISRRTREISPDRGTINYTYDLTNNVTTITEGRGITSTMTYDSLERILTKTYPNTITGKNENVSYTYDTCDFGLGFLCARIDESGSYSYHYDAYGNMSNGSFTEIEGTHYTMSYVYDDGDHITQMTLPSGRVVNYSRDGVRRVEAIDTTLNGVSQNIVSDITYRGDKQMLSYDYGNGLRDTRTYDLQGRLLTQQLEDALNTVLDNRTYSYDQNSNVLNIDTNIEDNAYLYDRLDRLTSDAIDGNTPIDYTYDQNDNRLTKLRQDMTLKEFFEQQENSNRLSVIEAVKAGLAPIENLPNRDLIYNDVGRLFQLIEEGTLKAEYIYNDAGQRTRKTIYQADGISVDSITIYHYDQMGNLITETTETGALIKDYIWQEGMTPMAQITAMEGGNTGNAGAVASEIISYLHTDHLMTNRLATDQSQSVVWRWEGEAFGNTSAQELAGLSVNLRFPGQYYDRETNLHYNHFRYYDPELGRYITSDPIGMAGGINTYRYVFANPTMFFDVLGLAWDCIYVQSTGRISCIDDQTGESVYEKCYSGSEDRGGKDDPDKQDDKDNGPIPRGEWGIGPYDDSKGSITIDLDPKPGNDVFFNGREPYTFRMHGDSQNNPGKVSEGCIVCSWKTRDALTNGSGGIIYVKAHPWSL